MITAERYHDISCGHRVFGHESKCAHIHGHNYRVTFVCSAVQLDNIGRVVDFSVIKDKLCMWLEENWDHKFLVWQEDPLAVELKRLDNEGTVVLPFNPTAENIANFLCTILAPHLMADTGVSVVKVTVEETRKCSASVVSPQTLYKAQMDSLKKEMGI